MKKNALREELSNKCKDIYKNFKQDPEALVEYLEFSARFRNYSHNNRIMIYAQRPGAMFVAPASAWREGLPNAESKPLSDTPIYIKKGEKALYVYAPVIQRLYQHCNSAEQPRRWSFLSAAEQKDYKTNPETWTVGEALRFKLVPVFDIGQVNCPPELLPKIIGIGEQNATAAQCYQALKEYAKTQNITVMEKDLGSVSLRGLYRIGENTILINSLFNDTQRLSTLAHELGHSALHYDMSTAFSKSQSTRELEADMYSLMVERLCGLETTDARKAHLQDSYKAFEAEQMNAPEDKRISIDEVFDGVFKRYNDSAAKIRETLCKQLDNTPIQASREEIHNKTTLPTQNL
ncbi:MAG: ImmA/IrrE family metallo-endopeptidase [Clostridia bacterium]|nr:ImmA/IrrE family metallo-endopeptidase [Clostridia bacterium]